MARAGLSLVVVLEEDGKAPRLRVMDSALSCYYDSNIFIAFVYCP